MSYPLRLRLIMKIEAFSFHFFASLLSLAFLVAQADAATTTIVDDDFADGDRTKTGALDADWWSSNSTSGNSVEIAVGQLGLVTGTSGRGMHATFASQDLLVGSSITATYEFTTPQTIGVNRSTAFKVAP